MFGQYVKPASGIPDQQQQSLTANCGTHPHTYWIPACAYVSCLASVSSLPSSLFAAGPGSENPAYFGYMHILIIIDSFAYLSLFKPRHQQWQCYIQPKRRNQFLRPTCHRCKSVLHNDTAVRSVPDRWCVQCSFWETMKSRLPYQTRHGVLFQLWTPPINGDPLQVSSLGVLSRIWSNIISYLALKRSYKKKRASIAINHQ